MQTSVGGYTDHKINKKKTVKVGNVVTYAFFSNVGVVTFLGYKLVYYVKDILFVFYHDWVLNYLLILK